MRRCFVILFTCFLLIFPSVAQNTKVSFDAQMALGYIKVLASDSMMGRKSGQPGGVLGEKYIASKFKEWKLEPAGDNGKYFQNFTIEHSHVGEGIALEVISEKERRSFYYRDDWRVQKYSGSGRFTEDVVFVGYGIHAPEKEYDDYEGVEVKGKLVLFRDGVPSKLKNTLQDEAKMENRIKAAQESGARGVLFFRPPSDRSRYYRIRLDKEIYKPDFVILSCEGKVTDFIFKDLDKDLNPLYQEIDRTSKAMSFNTGVKVFVSVNAFFDPQRQTRNVLAKITGSDEALKNEYIVIGAHMDHLGVSPLGEVYNGANDNASGTAVVMEVARIMKLNNTNPQRTVVFALWAAEEQGLLGSRYYADHGPYPIDKTIVNINLDMVGHGSGKIPFNGVYYGPQIWEVLKEKLPQEILDYTTPGRGGPGGSDHTPFLQKGIPAFFLMTRGAIKYHRTRDDSDLIQTEMLKKTGDLVHAAVKILGNEPGNFIEPLRQENYYLKYRTVINYIFSPVDHVVESHGETKDSHVKLQMALLEEKEGLTGDALRIDIIKNLLTSSENLKKAKGLSSFSTSGRIPMDTRMGKTTVLAGLRGFKSFGDDPRWAGVLSKLGVNFVLIDEPSALFVKEISDEARKSLIEAINEGNLLLFLKGASASEAKVLLEESKKPLVLLESELPGEEIMELIKESDSALGLILTPEADPAQYFKKLEEARSSIGTEHLMMVNEQCLWEEEGKNQMLMAISEIIKAKYERDDLSNIFSSTFLRVLNEARKGKELPPISMRPF